VFDVSSSSSAQVDAVCAGVYTARWFDDKCQGTLRCECKFEDLIQPNVTGVQHIVSHVFKHDCEKARLQGKEWGFKKRETEHERLQAKVIRVSGGRRRNTTSSSCM